MTFYWKDLSIELNSNFSKKVPRISRYRLDDNKFQHFQKGTLAEETLGEWLSSCFKGSGSCKITHCRIRPFCFVGPG
jgi:hypothetical protein